MKWDGLGGPGRGADFPFGAIHQSQTWAWQILENEFQTTFRKSDNRFRLPPRNCSWKVVFVFQNLGDKVVKLADAVSVMSSIAPLVFEMCIVWKAKYYCIQPSYLVEVLSIKGVVSTRTANVT
jgi:hypothetical protein